MPEKKASKAARPPAEAPMPTIGKPAENAEDEAEGTPAGTNGSEDGSAVATGLGAATVIGGRALSLVFAVLPILRFFLAVMVLISARWRILRLMIGAIAFHRHRGFALAGVRAVG